MTALIVFFRRWGSAGKFWVHGGGKKKVIGRSKEKGKTAEILQPLPRNIRGAMISCRLGGTFLAKGGVQPLLPKQRDLSFTG